MLIRICIASNWTFSKQPMHIFTQSCMDEIFTNTEYKRLTDVNYGFGFHAATNLSNSILKKHHLSGFDIVSKNSHNHLAITQNEKTINYFIV